MYLLRIQFIKLDLFRFNIFAFDALTIFNDLHTDVACATSIASFRKRLKTYLFAKEYPP